MTGFEKVVGSHSVIRDKPTDVNSSPTSGCNLLDFEALANL